MEKKYVLAIDQGTTGTKVLLLDRDGDVRGQAYGEIRQFYPQPGWVEHNAEEIWSGIVSSIHSALASAGAGPADVAAIGITNQRETALLWERETGRPVAPAIVWQDRRTAAICDELASQGYAETFRMKTGLVLDAYFSGTKIKWLLDNIEGLRIRAENGELAFGTIDSWIVWKLTSGRCHITDYSNASRTLLFNIHSLDWDDALLQLMNIPRELLPEVRSSSSVYEYTDPAVFGARVPIAGIAGDQQAALFGQGCYAPGTAKNTYGTGSFILLNTGNEPVQSTHGMLTTVGWRLGQQSVQYALEGAVFITGAAVQWLRDGLGLIQSAAETEPIAQSVTSNEGVFFVPALTGLGGPHWDPYARGTIVGITRGTTRAHIVRATLESICYQSLDVFEAMEKDSGIKLTELRVDGGAVANRFLMQFQSDILGVPVVVPSLTETTSLGAAYLAGLAVGFWSGTDEIASKWKEARRFDPKMSQSERKGLHEQWLRAVERAKRWTAE